MELRSRSCNCKRVLRSFRKLQSHVDFRAPSEASEAQTRRTSDLVDLTKLTAVSVEAASHGISNVEQKVDQIIVALSQIQLGVTQYASYGPIVHSSFTDMERRTQAIESLTSQVLPDLQNKLNQLPVRIKEDLAEFTTPTTARPSAETPNLTFKEAAIPEYLTGMVMLYD